MMQAAKVFGKAAHRWGNLPLSCVESPQGGLNAVNDDLD